MRRIVALDVVAEIVVAELVAADRFEQAQEMARFLAVYLMQLEQLEVKIRLLYDVRRKEVRRSIEIAEQRLLHRIARNHGRQLEQIAEQHELHAAERPWVF